MIYIPQDLEEALSEVELARLRTQIRQIEENPPPQGVKAAKETIWALLRENLDLSEGYDGPEVPQQPPSGAIFDPYEYFRHR